jgi:cell division protein FtsN
MVFALVVYYAYRQGMATGIASSETLPAVTADPRPIAEDVPLTADRDGARQEVQDLLAGNSTPRVVTAEDPARDALDGYSGAPTSMRREPVRQETVAERPASTDTVATAEREASEPPRRKPAASSAATEVAQRPVRQEPVRAAQATPAVQPAQQPVTTAAGPTMAGATHVVQVGAFDSNKAALDYFDGLSGKMGGLVSSKMPDIQVADVKGRTYHRLRIGPFTSKSDADAYCRSLKAKGQDCLVRGV